MECLTLIPVFLSQWLPSLRQLISLSSSVIFPEVTYEYTDKYLGVCKFLLPLSFVTHYTHGSIIYTLCCIYIYIFNLVLGDCSKLYHKELLWSFFLMIAQCSIEYIYNNLFNPPFLNWTFRMFPFFSQHF